MPHQDTSVARNPDLLHHLLKIKRERSLGLLYLKSRIPITSSWQPGNGIEIAKEAE
jgi:hypothetical protein